MVTSLSNLVDNLAEGIHKIKCKGCAYFLEYEIVKDNLIKHKCLSCNKNYSDKIDEELKNGFKKTLNFSNNDINKFILLLISGLYLFEYMDEWEKFNKTSLPEKEEFYRRFYRCRLHARKKSLGVEIKGLGKYHNLYLKSDILLSAD